MNRFVKNKIRLLGKWIISLLLVILMTLGLAACGEKQENGTDWVYVPQFLELEGAGNINWRDVRFSGDKLYYASNSWNELTDQSFSSLHRYSFLDGGAEELVLNLPEETYLTGWDIGGDGSLYALLAVWGGNEALGISDNAYMVAKYDDQGKELFVTDFSDLLDRDSYLDGLVVDGEDRVYVTEKSALWLFDAEGNPAGTLNLNAVAGGGLVNCCKGADGRVYVAVTGYSGNGSAPTLLSVNFEKKSLEEECPGFPTAIALIQNAEGSFFIHDGTSVSVYNDKTREKEKLFDWLDCDMDGSYVTGVGTLADGRLVAAFEDWSIDDRGIVVIDKLRADQVAPKQEIVLGTLRGVDTSPVVYFNRRNSDYHITVRRYLEDYDHLEDALNRLNADIVSDNCPDLIDLDFYYVGVRKMAANGVFEDLSPYLEQSSLDRSDMFENILEEYTYDGKLICVPGIFSIDTMIGSTARVGEEMGWSTEDVIALMDSYPEADLFNWTYRENLFPFLLDINAYVDWETGTCSFDSDEFKSLLEYVNRFPGYEEYVADVERSEQEKLQNGEVLLTRRVIAAFDAIQCYKAMFNEDITCIGYPNAGGSNRVELSASNEYAIMARSKVKDGAWAFIESCLTREYPTWVHNWGFPNSKSELERMAEGEVNVEYVLDENGEQVLDENGNPKVVGKTYSSFGEGDWRYHYRPSTREEVEMVLELIQSAECKGEPNYQMRVIIDEEVDAYFLGQKSLDDVVDIIQSRMQVYVSENY